MFLGRVTPYWDQAGPLSGSTASGSAPRDRLPSRLGKLPSPNGRAWICYRHVDVVALRPQVNYMAGCFRDCQAQ